MSPEAPIHANVAQGLTMSPLSLNQQPLHQQTAPRAEYFIPQWEERTSYGVRRIDPFAKLFEDRIIFLGTPISDDIANAVMAQLLCLQSMDADRDISIYINSPGGSLGLVGGHG